ncbi:MAG: RICIN domain-containing protein, partial [Actinomycetota bacterium]
TGQLRGYGNKCLDVQGPSTDNGTPIQLWDCLDQPNQTWTIEPQTPPPSSVLVGFGGKCLDVRGPNTDNGTPIQLWDCVGNAPQQRWELTTTGQLRGYGNKCLDVQGPSTDNGTPIQLWDCLDQPNQTWTFSAP